MTDEIGKGATWRAEIDQLFGLRWDTLVDWSLRVFLALWFWTSQIGQTRLVLPDSGPISWLIHVLPSASIDPPGWLVASSTWLVAPERTWIVPALAATSAACATFASRDYRRAGLRFLTLMTILLAFEASGDATPLLWAILFASIPAAIALVISAVGARPSSGRSPRRYVAGIIVQRVVMGVMGLYGSPVVAPVYLAYLLVVSYRVDVEPDERVEELMEIGRELREHPKPVSDVDGLVALSAIAALLSSRADPRSSRIASTAIAYARTGPTGARRM